MKIGIIGHFGGPEFFADGQTVKGKSLCEGFKLYPDVKIEIADTYYLRKKTLYFLFSVLKTVLFNKKIIFLPAHNARPVLFKFLYYAKKLLGKDIYHDCIAGSLDVELLDHPEWIKYLNSFKVNWMESPAQVERLKTQGISNVVYLPNFKNIKPLNKCDLRNEHNLPFTFCTFSRVEPMKGIEDALEAIKKVNQNCHRKMAHLDIFGPIQPGYEKWFEDILQKYHEECDYKGICQPTDSVIALKNYFALLFPTRYYTEGMPGTIIDAMFAGIPVIARRWAWCDNMITNEYNGISYDFEHPELLEKIMMDIAICPEKILSMKCNCLKEADKYSEVKIMKEIINTLKK